MRVINNKELKKHNNHSNCGCYAFSVDNVI